MLESYVGFDVETTGVDPEQDRVIQLGAVRVEQGEAVARWSALVDPGRPVPPAIQRLTGITDEALRGQPPLEGVLPAFLEFAGDLPLVAHNAPFDAAFLRAGLRRSLGREGDHHFYDTLELARLALPGLGGYRLQQVAEALGVAVLRAHDALADAETAALVFHVLTGALRGRDPAALRLAAGFLADVDPPLAAILGLAHTGESADGVAAPGAAVTVAAAGPDLAGPARDATPPGPFAFDPVRVAGWLEPGGPVAARCEGYEHRDGQVALLRAVAAAFSCGGTLMAEAGTGIGKSLAYLLPALAWARSSGRKVVVSTHTITLQEQLWRKDIPLLREALPFPFRVALLKGRSNYFCLLKWDALTAERTGEATDRRFFARLALWLGRTPAGDRAELSVRRDEERAWRAVAADEGCAGDRCRHRDRCFFLAARRRAEDAELVIVNHALLLADAAANNQVLPGYGYLVCDEAHHLPEAASRQFALRVDEVELLSVLADLRRRGPAGAGLLDRLARAGGTLAGSADLSAALLGAGEAWEAARNGVGALFDALRAWAARRPAAQGDAGRAWRLPAAPGGADGAPDVDPPAGGDLCWREVAAAGDDLAARLSALADRLDRLGLQVSGETAVALLGPEAACELTARRQAVADSAAALRSVLHPEGGEQVAWFEMEPGGGGYAAPGPGRLALAPLFPGPLLGERLFSRLEGCVLTSATLSIEGRFDFLAEELGLDAGEILSVPSPFDYRNQALVCVPTDLPDVRGRESGFTAEAGSLLLDLATAIGGRTLVLFTSHRMLRETEARIRGPLAEAGIGVLAQGIDGGQARLAEAFRADPRAVLLGSASFWEGVDIPGESLSCVVVMRLPFRPPGHPLVEARMEDLSRRGEDPFLRAAVPEAVIRFKQGFGRLIRRASDRGAFVVLDQRLLSRRAAYGHAFLESLPGPRLFSGDRRRVVAAVSAWLRGDEAGPAWPESDLDGAGILAQNG